MVENHCRFRKYERWIFFVGVADKTTNLEGFLQEELDSQIRFINGKMFSHLLPASETTFRYLPYQDGKEVKYIIDISVPKGKILPVLMKDEYSNILTFIRREGYTDQATAEEIRNMARSSASATFDTMNSDEQFRAGNFLKLFSLYKERNGEKDLSQKTLQGIGFFDDSGALKRGAVLIGICPIHFRRKGLFQNCFEGFHLFGGHPRSRERHFRIHIIGGRGEPQL